MNIVVFADSAFQRARPQTALVVLCTTDAFLKHEEAPVTVVDCRTRKCPKVCDSISQAESYATAEGSSAGLWIRDAFPGFTCPDYSLKAANSAQGKIEYPHHVHH